MRPWSYAKITLAKSALAKSVFGVASSFILGSAAPHAQPVPMPQIIDFDSLKPGEPAPGFAPGITGGQGTVSCLVQADRAAFSGGNVVTIVSSNRTNPAFPLCLHDSLRARNVDLSVRFKPVAGQLDQAAGVVLRARDFDNYYVVRANALEDNVRLYHVVAGRRTQFAGVDVPVPSGVWQSLRITAEGSHFTVDLDGKRLFDADDRTFTDTGRVGLWIKSDSVTLFDDFTIFSASE